MNKVFLKSNFNVDPNEDRKSTFFMFFKLTEDDAVLKKTMEIETKYDKGILETYTKWKKEIKKESNEKIIKGAFDNVLIKNELAELSDIIDVLIKKIGKEEEEWKREVEKVLPFVKDKKYNYDYWSIDFKEEIWYASEILDGIDDIDSILITRSKSFADCITKGN